MTTALTRLLRSSPKGLTLIEAALVLCIFAVLLVGVMTLFSSAADRHQSEVAELKPFPGETRTAKEMRKEGPSDYQLELLRQANEAHKISQGKQTHAVEMDALPGKSGTVAEVPQEGPSDYQLELLRQANEAHGIAQEVADNSLSQPVAQAETPFAEPISEARVTPMHLRLSSDIWLKTIQEDTISLTLRTGDSHATIHWGDGSNEIVPAHGSFSGSHRYSSTGSHVVRIEGASFEVISHSGSPDA